MSCFAQSLDTQTRSSIWDRLKLTRRLTLEMILILLIPTIAAVGPRYILGIWHPPEETFIVTFVKVGSIALLSYHTYESAPQTIYKITAAVMVFVVALLIAYIMLDTSHCSGDEGACAWIHDHNLGVLYGVSVISFIYMPIFWYQNCKLMRDDPNNLGLRRFCQAFIYGVNVPTVFAFVVVLIISLCLLKEPPDQFVTGAVALLVFFSTAGSICIDYYAKPFLVAGRGDCDPAVGTGGASRRSVA